jgi:hypothetical protein
MDFEKVAKDSEVQNIVEGYYDGTFDGDEAYIKLKDLGFNMHEIDKLLVDNRIRIYGTGSDREPIFYLKDGDKLKVNDDLYDVHFIDSTHFEMIPVDNPEHTHIWHVREWQDWVIKYNIKQEKV